jgi:signal transduction histidine kinase
MRERLRQLGGTLEFRSNGSGTLVTVQLPLTESSSSPNAIEVSDTSNAAA